MTAWRLSESNFDEWARRLRDGERRTLARLLTYAESSLPEHGRLLGEFLERVAPSETHALRVGVTGIPGAGKSTLIDALGSHWIGQGFRVAVLAVDPSSVRSGGSVLGDKVRMGRLSESSGAFIRPVPSGGALGGVTVHLDECARLCELAGYDRILIETVGVGQSEVDVALICDVLTVVVVPGTGDELQVVKRGITEFADVLLVNKCDTAGDAKTQALIGMYEEGLSLVQGRGATVLACSALSNVGVQEWANALTPPARSPSSSRAHKRLALFRRLIEHGLLRKYWEKTERSPTFLDVSNRVLDGRLTLRSAVRLLLDADVD